MVTVIETRIAPRLIGTSEAIRRLEDLRAIRVTAHMPGIGYDDKLCVRPRARQLPRRTKRRAEIETSVHQHARDVAEAVRIAQELVLVEPRSVGEVVGADPHECERGVGWTVAVCTR